MNKDRNSRRNSATLVAIVGLMLIHYELMGAEPTADLATGDTRASTRYATDKKSYVPPDYYTMKPPAAGQTYVDPVFGTTIKRISDVTLDDGGSKKGIWPEYSQHSSYNLDDTYLAAVTAPNGLFLYNEQGFFRAVTHPREVLMQNEPRWSRTNADWLYWRDRRKQGVRIWRYSVSTNSHKQIDALSQYKEISFGLGKGHPSDNDRIVIVADQRYLIAYDLLAGKTLSTLGITTITKNRIKSASMAPDGDRYVVGWDGPPGTARGRGMELYDLQGNFLCRLQNYRGHYCLGRDVDGSQALFISNAATRPQQPPDCPNGIVKIALEAEPKRTGILSIVKAGGSWGQAQHISALGNDGWVYVSTYRKGTKPAGWSTYAQEIFRIRADGSVVERLAHHRSSIQSYWKTPHANISMSGKRLVFGSDFMTLGGPRDVNYADVYVIGL